MSVSGVLGCRLGTGCTCHLWGDSEVGIRSGILEVADYSSIWMAAPQSDWTQLADVQPTNAAVVLEHHNLASTHDTVKDRYGTSSPTRTSHRGRRRRTASSNGQNGSGRRTDRVLPYSTTRKTNGLTYTRNMVILTSTQIPILRLYGIPGTTVTEAALAAVWYVARMSLSMVAPPSYLIIGFSPFGPSSTRAVRSHDGVRPFPSAPFT